MDDKERRTRKILETRPSENSGKNISAMGLAQNELSSVNAEQVANLKQEMASLQAKSSQRAAVTQAAQIGVQSAAEASQTQTPVQQQAGQMNQQTQALLRQYGINPSQRGQGPQTHQTQSNSSKQSGTTIENVTNTTSTTRNEIRVIQPKISVSQPSIRTQKPEIAVGRFNAWLQKAQGEQIEQEAQDKREYDRRERSLSRITSGLMKKIEEMTNSIGEKFNPETIGTSLSGSLKTMLFILAADILPTVWTPAMKHLAGLEGAFKSIFGIGENNQAMKDTVECAFIERLKDSLGATEEEKYKNKSLIFILRDLVRSGYGVLSEKFKAFMEDRGHAVDTVMKEKPEGSDIGEWFDFLGKVVKAAIGGTDGLAEVAGKKQEADVINDVEKNGIGGAYGSQKFSMQDLDEKGNLKIGDENTSMKAGSMAAAAISGGAKTGNFDMKRIQIGLNNVRESADKLGSVPISKDLLFQLGDQATIKRLIDSGQIVLNTTDYRWVRRDEQDISDYRSHEKGKETARTVGNVADWAATAAAAFMSGGSSAMAQGVAKTTARGAAGVALKHGVKAGAKTYAGASGADMLYDSSLGYVLNPFEHLSEGAYNLFAGDVDTNNNATLVKDPEGVTGGKRTGVYLISKKGIDELLGTKGESSLYTAKSYEAIKSRLAKVSKRRHINAPVSKEYLKAVGAHKAYEDRIEDIDKENAQFNRAIGTADQSQPYTEFYEVGDTGYEQMTVDGSVSISQGDQKNNSLYAMQYLIGKGLSPEQAAGVVGNLMQESGMNPGQYQKGGGGGYGIAQWTSSARQKALRSRPDYNTLQGQLDFLWSELKGNTGYREGNLEKLKKASNELDAAKIFQDTYERAGKPNMPRRYKYAKDALALWNQQKGNIQQQSSEFSVIGSTAESYSFTSSSSSSSTKTFTSTGGNRTEEVNASLRNINQNIAMAAGIDLGRSQRGNTIIVNNQAPQQQKENHTITHDTRTSNKSLDDSPVKNFDSSNPSKSVFR